MVQCVTAHDFMLYFHSRAMPVSATTVKPLYFAVLNCHKFYTLHLVLHLFYFDDFSAARYRILASRSISI